PWHRYKNELLRRRRYSQYRCPIARDRRPRPNPGHAEHLYVDPRCFRVPSLGARPDTRKKGRYPGFRATRGQKTSQLHTWPGTAALTAGWPRVGMQSDEKGDRSDETGTQCAYPAARRSWRREEPAS